MKSTSNRYRNRKFGWIIFACSILLFMVPVTFGYFPHFNRYDTLKSENGTVIRFKCSETPEASLVKLPDGRYRLVLKKCETGFIRGVKSYSDKYIRNVDLFRRGDDLVITLSLDGSKSGIKLHSEKETGVVIVSVGPAFNSSASSGIIPARNEIRSGAERVITQFDPPLDAGIPFVPVDRTDLYPMLSPEEARLVKLGEAMLYKGVAAEAERIFASVTHSKPEIQSLILSRLGESRYLLQKYPEACRDFQEAEKVFPGIGDYNQTAIFEYGDCTARSGNNGKSRSMLSSLIAKNSDKPFASMLLVRLADILLRSGKSMEAQAIYSNVLKFFPDSPAAKQSRMKLADRKMFSLDGDSYINLLAEYREIRDSGGTFKIREEAAFRYALLNTLYGTSEDAVNALDEFISKNPRSSYYQIASSMLETLLAEQLTELSTGKNYEKLADSADKHREYIKSALSLGTVLEDISYSFDRSGRSAPRLKLFSYLEEHNFVESKRAFVLQKIVEDALTLGDEEKAENAANALVKGFSTDRKTPEMRDVVARLAFGRKDYKKVISALSTSARTKEMLYSKPDSLYYLGKSRMALKEYKEAVEPLKRFIAETAGSDKTLSDDAGYALSIALEKTGNSLSAREKLSQALKNKGTSPEILDQLKYRLAEISFKQGKISEAKKLMNEIAEKGSDPAWKILAKESIISSEIDEEIKETKKYLSRR